MTVVELTQELVRIPSENPTGTEKAIAAYAAQWLRAIPGVEVTEYEVVPGRPNVVARLRGTEAGPGLAYLGHMDTVPQGEGWVMGAFSGDIKDGKLYGRGSCDMKGGLAAAMMALKNASESGKKPRRDFTVVATMDEEGSGMMGAVDLVKKGYVDKDTFVIATEPTGLGLGVAHKGVLWYEVVAEGKNSHAGSPQVGVDAVHGMARIICALKDKVAALPFNHPVLGKAAITSSIVEGGVKTNVVPHLCRAEFDVRLVPPMTVASTADLFRQAIAEVTATFPGLKASFRQTNIDRPPVETDPSSPVIAAFKDANLAITGAAIGSMGLPAYTDASIVSAITGNPHCALYGPGHLGQAHTIDEFVPVDELITAEKVLTEAAYRLVF